MIQIKEKKYILQTTSKNCFVYSALNAAIYLGQKNLPDFELISEIANKDGYTDEQGVIDFLNLPMRKTRSEDFLFTSGGIGILQQPKNLHAVFIEPEEDNKIKIINSGLSSELIDVWETVKIIDYLPANRNHRLYWAFK